MVRDQRLRAFPNSTTFSSVSSAGVLFTFNGRGVGSYASWVWPLVNCYVVYVSGLSVFFLAWDNEKIACCLKILLKEAADVCIVGRKFI